MRWRAEPCIGAPHAKHGDVLNSFRLALLPGEGIGPEVMDAALHVLAAVERRFGLSFGTDNIPGGAHHYKATGTTLPPDGLGRAGAADAMLFGAMGWPGIRLADGTEIAPQLDLREHFQLYAGVRPIRAIPGVPTPLADPRATKIDLVIVRESTEGLFASRGRGVVTADEARETMVITRATTARLTAFSCRLAERRRAQGRPGVVTLVDKANVFRAFAFMREVFYATAAQFPGVEARHHYVDAMALDLIRRPWDFDVLPTENMFGDILSDLGAGLIGGMGFAPSADIGDTHALFQPSHGTAPDIAGQGIANPTAMILSMAMLLEWLGETRTSPACTEAGQAITAAVDAAFLAGLRTHDIRGTAGTADTARTIAEHVLAPVSSGRGSG